MQSLGMDSTEIFMRELDKLPRRGPAAVIDSLEAAGAPAPAARELVGLAERGVVKGEEAYALLDELKGRSSALLRGSEEVSEVLTVLETLGVPSQRFGLDVGIARGLDYYTGTVYETRLLAHPELGSICSGGRYENLAGHYTRLKLPGVGISIGLSRLFWQLRSAALLPDSLSTVTALVALIDDDGLEVALQLAAQLRQAGINTESAMEERKLGAHLRYADRAGIAIVIVAGPEERAKGEVLVRDLKRQSQEMVGMSELVASVLRIAGQ
jgi:histidyl-tRNA synthetase